MAGASNSDDDSGIFWPGYVDAVTNLAINLLFVIAVMALVVLTAILQISKMKNVDAVEQKNKQAASEQTLAAGSPSTAAQASSTATIAGSPVTSAAEMQQQRETGGTANDRNQPEVVTAQTKKTAQAPGKSRMFDGASGGVVVAFANDVIDLSDEEKTTLIQKLGGNSVATGKWQLRVIVPKGFSEASRIGFYRLGSIRNILIAKGVDPKNIELRLIEAESANANNARVQVRRP